MAGRDFEAGAESGQWCAQFMSGVGHEAALAFRGSRTWRQHFVQCRAKAGQFVGACFGNSPGEVTAEVVSRDWAAAVRRDATSLRPVSQATAAPTPGR